MKTILILVLLAVLTGCRVNNKLSELHWQKRLERAVGDGGPPPDDGLCPTNSATWLYWKERTKLSAVGMSRSDVEKMLPFYNFPEHGPHPTVGGATVYKLPGHKDWMYQWYYIAPDFIAQFIYDNTGPLELGDGPNQRLMHPPILIHHDFTKSSSFYFPANAKKAVPQMGVP